MNEKGRHSAELLAAGEACKTYSKLRKSLIALDSQQRILRFCIRGTHCEVPADKRDGTLDYWRRGALLTTQHDWSRAYGLERPNLPHGDFFPFVSCRNIESFLPIRVSIELS